MPMLKCFALIPSGAKFSGSTRERSCVDTG
ncbi:MAG: hypothetical protein JWO72_72, partial [Caulobacteraceae bacterium]|nr:hypothetical protein [Caulobacteraceae bacterium]